MFKSYLKELCIETSTSIMSLALWHIYYIQKNLKKKDVLHFKCKCDIYFEIRAYKISYI